MKAGTKFFKGNEYFQLGFFFLSFALAFIMLLGMPRMSIPLLIAYIMYLIISPIIPIVMKLGITKSWAISIIFVVAMGIISIPIISIVPTIKTETERLKYYLPKVEISVKNTYRVVRDKIKEKTGHDIGDKILITAIENGKDVSTSLLKVIPTMLASFLEWLIVVPFFLFFLLKDRFKFKMLILRFTPNSILERFYHLAHQFNKKLGNYMLAKFIEASIVGTIIIVGLLIIDIRFAILLGLLAMISNIVPYIGPFIGMVPGILVALVEFGTDNSFVAVVILYIIANIIDLALVFPILVSKIVDLHPVLVVISVIVGSQYLGMVGMIISIPAAVALKLIVTEFYREIYLDSNI